MAIVPAQRDQVETLVDMWLALAEGQRDHDSHILPSENRIHVRESVLRHVVSGRVFVAEETSLRGFVMFSVESGRYELAVTRGIVENLYVVPEYRNRGIGSALLDAAESKLYARGVDVVTLDVLAANADARSFYERHGYRPHRVELEKRVGESAEDGAESDTHSKGER